MIQPDKRNANKGTARGRELLSDSLRQHGAGRSILLDRYGVIIAGNKTHDAAQALGLPVRVIETDGAELIAVQRTDLDLDNDDHARPLAYLDNRSAELDLDWDLARLLDDRDEGLELSGVGFSQDELNALIAAQDRVTRASGAAGKTDPDAVPEAPAVPVTQPGDVWLLGAHRLLCGDSTSPADVARLMAGQLASIGCTDPPWGVDYQGGHNATKRARLARDDDGSIYAASLPQLHAATTPDAPLYLCFGGAVGLPVYRALADSGYQIRALLFWHKLQAHYGGYNAQYMQKHEPFLYCHKRGQSPPWYGPTNEVTVWEYDQPARNELHPTQKPVVLTTRALANSSLPGAIVLDLFGGSGSTLIGAEQTGRICYMAELAPAYCDVIVQRWQDYTGKAARRGA